MDNFFDLSNKIVVITGACGLIGKKLSYAFHHVNSKLVLADLPILAVEEFASELGEDTLGVSCDVAISEQVSHLVDVCIKEHSRVDVLINCHQFKPKGFLESQAETFPEELWDSIIDANLKGTFLTCRGFGKHMVDQNKGAIINFASVYGIVSSNPALYEDNSMGNPIAYSASKGGVITMSKYLAAYWAKFNVRVNCITPHGVSNNHEENFVKRFSALSPMGRLMNVEEVVGGVLFLASEASSYVTGTNLVMDGGWTTW